jgi:CheY-like chemotaxis protein
VIEVGVRQQNVGDGQAVLRDGGNQLIDFVSRIDDDGFTCSVTSNDEPVLEERRDGPAFEDYHLHMVLCVVDDLMFSVKISTTAKAIGAPIFFERNPEMVVARIREKQPSLVIFDLNSAKLRPLDAIAALKADPELRLIPTLGYVSHVQTDVIEAARRAGIDQVLARSAFTERLAEILSTPPATPADQSPQG